MFFKWINKVIHNIMGFNNIIIVDKSTKYTIINLQKRGAIYGIKKYNQDCKKYDAI